NGNGSFSAAINFTVGTNPYSVAVGDFNSDGKLDIVVANYGSNNVSVLLATCIAPVPYIVLSSNSLSFGSTNVGTSATAQNVTITNTGNANLDISNIAITGAASSDYSFSGCSATPFSLVPNDSCTLSVNFNPTATGTRNATLAITDNASGSPHTVSLAGTG